MALQARKQNVQSRASKVKSKKKSRVSGKSRTEKFKIKLK